MQTLWTRAAQVRSSCKCALCIPVHSGVLRRATVTPAAKRIAQGDLFLVFSSTIAFEAAVIDSSVKKEKFKRWDKILEEERAQVLAVETDQRRRIDQLLENAEKRAIKNTPTRRQKKEDNVFYRSKSISKARRGRAAPAKYLHWDWGGVFDWSQRCDAIREERGFRAWKGVPLNWLTTLSKNELHELVNDKRLLSCYYGGPTCEDLDPSAPAREYSMQKLITMEWSILKMTYRLLQECRSREIQRPNITSRETVSMTGPTSIADFSTSRGLLEQANYILNKIYASSADSVIYEKLKRPKYPAYSWDEDTHDEDIYDLNQSLHTRLQKLKTREGLTSVLSLICGDLLSSTVPPNTHAYNLLLVRLCQLQETNLVWIVLDSMHETHIRPNEITHATLLRYFTMTSDLSAFCTYIDKMSGKKRGLAIAHPELAINPLVARQFRSFGRNLQRIAVVARKNQEVYTSLIVGILRFFHPRDAMYWYRAMINDGWRPTAEILVNVLSKCCTQLDWDGGMAVWKQFHSEKIKITSIAYEWMLELCRVCGKEDYFQQILNEGIRLGALTARILDLPPDVLCGDVDVLLEKAQNHVKSPGYSSGIPPAVRKELQEFEESEGRHLIENALSKRQQTRAAARERLASLSHLAAKFAALKRARTSLRLQLDRVTFDIQRLTERVFQEVLVPEHLVIKYKAHVIFETTPTNMSASVVHTAYEKYRKSSTASLARHRREVLRQSSELEPKTTTADIAERKPSSSEQQVDALDVLWFPQVRSPDKVEEVLEAATG